MKNNTLILIIVLCCCVYYGCDFLFNPPYNSPSNLPSNHYRSLSNLPIIINNDDIVTCYYGEDKNKPRPSLYTIKKWSTCIEKYSEIWCLNNCKFGV